VELTEADSGAEHSVGVGQELVVRLPENRTTGYRWHLSLPDGDGVVVDDDRFEPDATGRAGAGGTRTFRLRPTRPGTHRVGAERRRPWEAEGTGSRVEFTLSAT
jgi:predicted secreted protein